MMEDKVRRLFSLAGTRGVVTGGSGGLGLSIARLLVEAGAEVHAFSRSGVAKDAGEDDARIVHHAVDVTDQAAAADRLANVGRDGGLDFVVNNAGITGRARFEEASPAEWERIMAVNVTAAAELTRSAFPLLKASRHPGRVVFVTSMAAHLSFDEVTAYCASKAALLGLMRGLAGEWARHGILVNSVAPGWFPSEMTQRVMDESRRAKILARMPLHRFGKPEELAAAVLFLLSPAATYVHGHDLAVDGGALSFGF